MDVWHFLVAPHRGATASGLWSVRLDGTLIGIHASYADAMRDAVSRAARHWADTGVDSKIEVAEAAETSEARTRSPAKRRELHSV